MHKSIAAAIVLLCVVAADGQSASAKAKAMVGKMSLDEKITLLVGSRLLAPSCPALKS